MTAEVPLRTAQATFPFEIAAQEGLPKPVAVPVEMKLPQLAQESGASPRQTDKSVRRTAIPFMDILQVGF
jgi:hypothetical protein